jgi:hypothetical protein
MGPRSGGEVGDGALSGANEFVERELDRLATQLEEHLDMDLLAYVGPLHYGVDDLIRDALESRFGGTSDDSGNRRDSLAVVLQTEGGDIEPVRRIVDVFRHCYSGRVEFVIPNYAMSAGTILVMSGDAIHMDYYSVLGPIDPQTQNEDGDLVPALGYLAQYEHLLDKANKGKASSAEIAILMRFDQTKLYKYEQDRQLSIALLKEWLVKYKFKDWIRTETRRKPVTPAMRERRAKEIASILNETDRWHSHGHGITMEVLRRELNLKIDDFGEPSKAPLSEFVRSYHRLLLDYMLRLARRICVHRPGHIRYLGGR